MSATLLRTALRAVALTAACAELAPLRMAATGASTPRRPVRVRSTATGDAYPAPALLHLRGGSSAQVAPVPQPTVLASSPRVVATEPFEGQKPGTSGLRKKTAVFQQPGYLENFIQSIFDALPDGELAGSTLVVSGDGRYHNAAAIQTICRMAAANGVARVWVGVGGLLSTPAASAVIREREGGVATGGILLTASHNPGGPDNDFGVKYNVQNGGPALESFTNAVYEHTTKMKEYRILDLPEVDLSRPARHLFTFGEAAFEVEVIDPTQDYVALLRRVFDLPALRSFLSRPDVTLAFDGMHGVAGPYARALLVSELGVPPSALRNCVPSETFSNGHPDPNLVYAAELVALMGLTPSGTATPAAAAAPVFGAACDGDADRNMVLGRGFFVTPSDSLAVIAAHAHLIPWFANGGGLRAIARSMPTSAAVDRVAARLGLPFFETPTGWKFFGNLMDSEELGGEALSPLLCGEESFGTGSSHVREKDGLWAVLCWLSILMHHNVDSAVGSLVGIDQIVRQHWQTYGRNYYARYDYETVDAGKAAMMLERLRGLGDMFRRSGHSAAQPLALAQGLDLVTVDEFEYHDPIDGSVSTRQGMRLLFADGSRIIFRLSGTGSVGATVRIYIEQYVPPEMTSALEMATSEALAPLISLALELSQVQELTGRDAPTVIT